MKQMGVTNFSVKTTLGTTAPLKQVNLCFPLVFMSQWYTHVLGEQPNTLLGRGQTHLEQELCDNN